MRITIPERGDLRRVVPALEVSRVEKFARRHVLGWDGHVTLRSGERVATVDVHDVLRQVAAVRRARAGGEGTQDDEHIEPA